MEITKQEVEQLKELNELLSEGEMKDQPKTLEFIGGLLANRCYQDEAFAKAFRADPDAAVRELASEIGIELPGKLKIAACENDENTWHVPMPSQAQLDKLRKTSLSDAQMAQVTGGEVAVGLAVLAGVAAVGGTLTAIPLAAGLSSVKKDKNK